MNRIAIRLTIVFGIISIIGIVVIQVYFIQKSFNIKQKQIDQSIMISLRDVAETLIKYNNNVVPLEKLVHQYSSNYFVVNVNDNIDANILEYYLKEELKSRNIHLDFEYAIYDCTTDNMIYGNYVHLTGEYPVITGIKKLPKHDEYVYYFGVHFPGKPKYLTNNMKIWYFFSAVLLLVIVFFGYTQFVILKQRRLGEIQKDFVNNMTHEFKTPVTSLQISADVMARASACNDRERLSKYAEIIKQQSNQLLSHIDKILQVTSLVPRKTNLEKSLFGLNEIVNEIVEQFQENKDNTAIAFDFINEEVYIHADKVHFVNIVYNLLDNAIKYSPPDSMININILSRGNKVKLIIEDNGIGIDPVHQKRIFQKFYRVPVGNLHDVKGFGLGLFYVKSIIKAHGWYIQLNSEVNKGSKFTISIPLEKGPANEAR